jgi:hypothetical protein
MSFPSDAYLGSRQGIYNFHPEGTLSQRDLRPSWCSERVRRFNTEIEFLSLLNTNEGLKS